MYKNNILLKRLRLIKEVKVPLSAADIKQVQSLHVSTCILHVYYMHTHVHIDMNICRADYHHPAHGTSVSLQYQLRQYTIASIIRDNISMRANKHDRRAGGI